jgi:transposase
MAASGAGLRSDFWVSGKDRRGDGAITGAAFRACAEQFLAPALAPGDVVVAGNLACHKAAGVRAAIGARGATIRLLPPCLPDLNTIERAFSKLKAHLRKAAPRSPEAPWRTIGTAAGHFTPAECTDFLVHSGCTPSARTRPSESRRARGERRRSPRP